MTEAPPEHPPSEQGAPEYAPLADDASEAEVLARALAVLKHARVGGADQIPADDWAPPAMAAPRQEAPRRAAPSHQPATRRGPDRRTPPTPDAGSHDPAPLPTGGLRRRAPIGRRASGGRAADGRAAADDGRVARGRPQVAVVEMQTETPQLAVVVALPVGAAPEVGSLYAGEVGALRDKMLGALDVPGGLAVIGLRRVRDPRAFERAANAQRAFLGEWLGEHPVGGMLVLGELPVGVVFGQNARLPQVRGQLQDALGVPAIATWDAAYLIEQPRDKRAAWTDMQALLARLC